VEKEVATFVQVLVEIGGDWWWKVSGGLVEPRRRRCFRGCGFSQVVGVWCWYGAGVVWCPVGSLIEW
jgi:hypothetical protein